MAFIVMPLNRLPLHHVDTTSDAMASKSRCPSRRAKPSCVATRVPLSMCEQNRNSNGGDDASVEETVSLEDLKARLSAPQATEVTKDVIQAGDSSAVAAEEAQKEALEDTRSEKQKEIDRLRAAEKFIEVDEGKYECTGCAFLYEPSKGDRRNNIAPDTQFQDLPPSYTCPQCRTPKRRFVPRKKVIAGFADNQKYGFGSNTLTGGQKSILIFGGLALCALLLLSGYAMN